GYHPTLAIVPTFDGDVYSTLHLLARDKVSDVARYFAHGDQEPSRSVVLGRVFDPQKRTPLAEQKFGMTYRNGKPPLYYGALPDPKLKSTSKSGLFAFFNLLPSFRALNRLESTARSGLINLMPDFGYFVELGRGGMGKLRGRLFDPFQGTSPDA